MSPSSAPAGVLRSRMHAVFGCILLHAAGRHAVLRIPADCRVTGRFDVIRVILTKQQYFCSAVSHDRLIYSASLNSHLSTSAHNAMAGIELGW